MTLLTSQSSDWQSNSKPKCFVNYCCFQSVFQFFNLRLTKGILKKKGHSQVSLLVNYPTHSRWSFCKAFCVINANLSQILIPQKTEGNHESHTAGSLSTQVTYPTIFHFFTDRTAATDRGCNSDQLRHQPRKLELYSQMLFFVQLIFQSPGER